MKNELFVTGGEVAQELGVSKPTDAGIHKGYEAEAEAQYLADKGAYLMHKIITIL